MNAAYAALTSALTTIGLTLIAGAALILALVMLAAALPSVLRSIRPAGARALWALVCLVPVLGPALWFAFGETAAEAGTGVADADAIVSPTTGAPLARLTPRPALAHTA